MDINIFFFGLVIEKIEENVDVFKSKFKLGYSIFFSFSSFQTQHKIIFRMEKNQKEFF